MNITKCDICKKQIRDFNREIRVASLGKFSSFVFCDVCGKPVMKFLEKYRLLKKVTKPKKLK